MDPQYAPMAATRKRKAVLPSGIIALPSKLRDLAARNLRFRELFRLLFGESDAAWKYLWTVPPTRTIATSFSARQSPLKRWSSRAGGSFQRPLRYWRVMNGRETV